MADFNVDCVFSYFVTINFTYDIDANDKRREVEAVEAKNFLQTSEKFFEAFTFEYPSLSTKFFLRYLSDVQVVLSFATPPIFHCFACLQA